MQDSSLFDYRNVFLLKMEEGKIGANHLIIAGILTHIDYARADYLAMHLEQHLSFHIERHGKLPEQWQEYYEKVLVPLEITSDAIKEGQVTIYSREGRLIGDVSQFEKLMKTKYNVSVTCSNEWLEELKEMHERTAKLAIADKETNDFNEKVDAFLKQRQDSLEKMQSILEGHKETVATAEKADHEIQSIVAYLKPTTDACYALHHYPVPEEKSPEEEEKGESSNAEGNEENAGEQAEDAPKPTEEGEKAGEEQPPAEEPKPEEQPQENPENAENQENPEEPKPDEQPKAENGEEEENKTEEPKPEEPPKEEEEVGEPDPEAVELQTKLQEAFKLPELPVIQQMIAAGDKNGLQDFVTEVNQIFEDAVKLVKAERFKWKKFEQLILSINEKCTLASNMIKISIISAETMQIKAIETEIDKYENFVIEGVDENVLEAGAIRFAATYQFV